MTGGRIVVLGRTGRNFAAGMSGGMAYVLDTDGSFALNCNIDMVDLERLDRRRGGRARPGLDRAARRADGQRHRRTGARRLGAALQQFVAVMPRDFKRVKAAEAKARVGVTRAALARWRRRRPWARPPASSIPARQAAGASGHGTRRRLPPSLLRLPGRRADAPGVAMHGLRHPVLPPGLPARQPDSRLERSRLSRLLEARPSSGCTRPTTSLSSRASSAPRRAKDRASSASTRIR